VYKEPFVEDTQEGDHARGDHATRSEAITQGGHHVPAVRERSLAYSRGCRGFARTCYPSSLTLDTSTLIRLDTRQDDQSHAYIQFTPHRNNHERNNHSRLHPCHTHSQPLGSAQLVPAWSIHSYTISSSPPRCSLTLRLSTLSSYLRSTRVRLSPLRIGYSLFHLSDWSSSPRPP
jgi:hypothetical protein